jgi:hypothetical protein
MSKKILLIHGFAQALDFKPFRKSKKKSELFPVFNPEIESKDAIIFDWALNWKHEIKDFLNIQNFHKLYFAERELASSQKTLESLNKAIKDQNPDLILAHSMGAFLLFNYFQKYSINPDLKKICLVQADIDFDAETPNNLYSKSLSIQNFYCHWDQALIYSTFLHKKPRAGLIGLKNNRNIENQFLPLLEIPNPHQDILRSKRLKKVMEINKLFN